MHSGRVEIFRIKVYLDSISVLDSLHLVQDNKHLLQPQSHGKWKYFRLTQYNLRQVLL
jgi:hypothetical protein